MTRCHTLAAPAAALAAVLLMAGTPATAYANGRFPKSTNVYLPPANAQVGTEQNIYLGVTFGMLVSHDGGESFQWICEEAIGYGGAFDPDYAIAADGSIFATTFEGLRVSRDGGCSWENAGGLSPEEYFAEVEIDPNGVIWAATASGTLPNHVYVSTDNGASFEARDTGLPQVWWKSLRVAASDPQRVYVTGYRVAEVLPDGGQVPPTAVAYRSDDGGASWTELDLAGVEFGTEPWLFVELVSPDNPDLLFGRSQGAVGAIGDILYRSGDGGATWVEVLRSDVKMQTVLMRQSGTLVVGTLTSGVYKSFNGGNAWEQDNLPQMCCLGEDRDGTLYSCGANWDPDFFALGKSIDGENWDKVVRFSEVSSALSCPSGTIQRDVCEAKRWPSLCEMFGCAGGVVDAGPPPDARIDPKPPGGCCDAGTGTPWSALLPAMLVIALLARRRQV